MFSVHPTLKTLNGDKFKVLRSNNSFNPYFIEKKTFVLSINHLKNTTQQYYYFIPISYIFNM